MPIICYGSDILIFMLKFLPAPVLLFALATAPALANTLIPKIGKFCPEGSITVGAGYCKTQSANQFVARLGEFCPKGTKTAGAGYCKVN